MKKLFAICWCFAALTLSSFAYAATISTTSTTSVQEVRFAQQTIPNGGVTPPQVVIHPNAAYTDEAHQRGIEGNVIVQAQFDADGNFKVLRVVKGLGYGLDENALVALQNWRFSPALRNGAPVSAIAEIEIPFRLPDDERIKLKLETLHQKMIMIEKMKKQVERAQPAAQR